MTCVGLTIEVLESRTLLAADFSALLTIGNENSVQNIVSVANDPAGNLYVTGTFEGTIDFAPGASVRTLYSKQMSVFLAKYSAAGGLEWVRKVGNPTRDTTVSELAVDSAGNVYFAGRFGSTMDLDPGSAVFNVRSNGEDDVYIAKLNTAGRFQWGGSVGGSYNDEIHALSVTPAGDVYFSGQFLIRADMDPTARSLVVNSHDTGAVYVVKMSSAGQFRWLRTLDGDPDNSYFVRSQEMTVAGDGSIYVAGYFKGRIDFDPGAGLVSRKSDGVQQYLLKLNAGGQFQWVDVYGQDGRITVKSMGSDAAGNLYLAGQFTDSPDFNPSPAVLALNSRSDGNSTFGGDIFVQKISRSGKLVWVGQIGGSDAQLQFMDMAVDPAGNAYLTGAFNDTVDFDPGAGQTILHNDSNESPDWPSRVLDGANAFIEKLTPAGGVDFVRTIGNDDTAAIGTTVSVDPSGNIYTGGLFDGKVNFNPGGTPVTATASEDPEGFILKLRQ